MLSCPTVWPVLRRPRSRPQSKTLRLLWRLDDRPNQGLPNANVLNPDTNGTNWNTVSDETKLKSPQATES
ncbi:hypothetical protein ElyMa_007017900 [Elysia marginata]|uniref:Uncharacterized protein n=1 Tax=Elysia marginata TaxID=1093978 RepID=A0AAV4JQJ4_9GAST|nr:hypothetical protein ElyMa_007017900 [Elysia marginata]